MKNISYTADLEQSPLFWRAGSDLSLERAVSVLSQAASKGGIITGMGCSAGVATALASVASVSGNAKVSFCSFNELRDCAGSNFGILITGRGAHHDANLAYEILRHRVETLFIVCASRNSPLLKRIDRSNPKVITICPNQNLPSANAFTPVGTTAFTLAAGARLLLGGGSRDFVKLWDIAEQESENASFPTKFRTPTILHVFAAKIGLAAANDLCRRVSELGGIIPIMQEQSAFAHGGYRVMECMQSKSAVICFEDVTHAKANQWLRKQLPKSIPQIVLRTQQTGASAILSLFLQQLFALPQICRTKPWMLIPTAIPAWGNTIYLGLGKRTIA